MVLLHFSILALLSLPLLNVLAEDTTTDEDTEVPLQSPNLAVTVTTSFPDSEVFGVKLINGYPTKALLSFFNQEPESINVVYVGGSLWGPAGPGVEQERIIRNLTATRYSIQIPAGEKESVSYSFATELHPQDLKLRLFAMVTSDMGTAYTVQAFNETVSIVEPDASFFDPQLIFLYLFLLAGFGGTCYFIYNTWITTLFPQKARGGKGGDRAKRSTTGSKKVDPSDQVSVLGADGPAVTSGAKAYDESWIPAHHIQRPEAKRVKSGARPKSRGKPE